MTTRWRVRPCRPMRVACSMSLATSLGVEDPGAERQTQAAQVAKSRRDLRKFYKCGKTHLAMRWNEEAVEAAHHVPQQIENAMTIEPIHKQGLPPAPKKVVIISWILLQTTQTGVQPPHKPLVKHSPNRAESQRFC